MTFVNHESQKNRRTPAFILQQPLRSPPDEFYKGDDLGRLLKSQFTNTSAQRRTISTNIPPTKTKSSKQMRNTTNLRRCHLEVKECTIVPDQKVSYVNYEWGYTRALIHLPASKTQAAECELPVQNCRGFWTCRNPLDKLSTTFTSMPYILGQLLLTVT